MLCCPVCGNKDYNFISKLCSNMKILGSQFPESDTNIVECKNCGVLYFQSQAEQQHYTDYYRSDISRPVAYCDMFGKDDTDEYFAHILKTIEPYLKENSKILEMGSGLGELSIYLKENTSHNVSVLDMKDKCMDFCEENGLTAHKNSSVDDLSFLYKTQDVIILNHILEHIADLKTTIQNVKSILKDGGFIFVELPDVEGYCESAELNSPYSFLTYEHIVHFSMNDLNNLFVQYGFEIVDSGKYFKKVSNYPSIWAILKTNDKCIEEIKKSDNTRDIKEYIQKSQSMIRCKLERVEKSGEKLILWGIGASTALLLEDFAKCNIIQLVDNNPLRQGINYSVGEKFFIIQSPQDVKDDDATIFIMSGPYKASIEKQIREMGFKNKILSF